MPSNNDKYMQEELVIEGKELKDLHTKFKDAVHDAKVTHQGKFPSRKELISMSTVYTKSRDSVIKLAKARDKKIAKLTGQSNGSKLRVARVDEKLAQFLNLRERNLVMYAKDKSQWLVYPDTLVTSNFTNWVIANGRQDGREVKLYGLTDPFVQLFLEDLKKPGSGPSKKSKDSEGKEVVTYTSVLDANGVQINPFFMNGHMNIFASHYPRVYKTANGKYTEVRDIISKDEYPEVYALMQREHSLFTKDLKHARNTYKDAQNKLDEYLKKKEQALEVGDRNIIDSINKVSMEVRQAKTAYIQLMNMNGIQHNLRL